jgi:hypothetical protein
MRGLLSSMALIALAVPLTGCGNDGQPKPSCLTDKVLCPPHDKNSTKVTCDCECKRGLADVNQKLYHGIVPACLPPKLNPATGTLEQRQALNDMDRQLYNQEVEKYCQITTENFVRAQIKAQFATGTGDPITSCPVPVSCDCKTTTPKILRNAICIAPCGDITCTAENCQGVAKTAEGTIDFEGCLCTRSKPCGLTQPPKDELPICTDAPGGGDPPTNDFGIVGRFLAAQSTAKIDPAGSSVTATASFDDHLGITRSSTKSAELSGAFYTYGTPHADGSADLIVDFGFTGTDMTFVFKDVDLIKDIEVPITNLIIGGGTDRTEVHFAPNGQGWPSRRRDGPGRRGRPHR